jgi:hypothetical protein
MATPAQIKRAVAAAEAEAGVRHVRATHDGKKLGHTEPLDPDNPFAGRRGFVFPALNNGPRALRSVRSVQARSLTRKTKGK